MTLQAGNDKECFNCHRLGIYARDYTIPNKRQMNKNNQGQSSNKKRQSSIRNRAHQATAKNNNKDEDSNPKLFAPDTISKAFMVKEQRLQKGSKTSTWFFNSCVSRHLCNNRKLFINMRAKSIDFLTAAGQIIWTEEVGTVSIPLSTGRIELHNVTLAPDCNSNLISLGQLKESGITYHDNPEAMTLMRIGKINANAKREQNFFTLDLAQLGKVIAMTS